MAKCMFEEVDDVVLEEGIITEAYFSPEEDTPLGRKRGLWTATLEQSSGPPLQIEIEGNGGDRLCRVRGGCYLSVQIISRCGNIAQAALHMTEAELHEKQRKQFKGKTAKNRITEARKKGKKS